jgi:hypothetical protein
MSGRRPRDVQKGAVLVAAFFFLVVVGAFFTLAINTAILMDSRVSVQSAADSAALAAARSLDGTAGGLDLARAAAQTFNDEHRMYGGQVGMTATSDADLEFGMWHRDADKCSVDFEGRRDCFEVLPTSEPRAITAVRVRNGRDATHNGPIELPFAVWGAAEARIASLAVAEGAGPGGPGCAFPMAVAECRIVNGANQLLCESGTPQRLDFSNANDDGIGFINMYYPDDNQAPGPPFVADVIRNRRCNDEHYSVGEAKLQDGNSMNDQVIEAIRGVKVTGKKEVVDGPCLIGTTQNLAVIDEGCPGNPNFHGVQQVVGFVKARIVAVTNQQRVSQGCPGRPAPVVTPAAPQRSVTVEILCDVPADEDDDGGGRAYNASGVTLRLVR